MGILKSNFVWQISTKYYENLYYNIFVAINRYENIEILWSEQIFMNR